MVQSVGSGLLLLCVLVACAATESIPAPTRTPAPTPTALPPLLIVTLGDSLTWGDKDDAPGGWPRRLLPLAQQARQQSKIINLAQPGWTARDLLRGRDGVAGQIDQAVKILHEASGDMIATLWIGVNDLYYLYEFGDPTSAEEAREADRFERDLDESLDRLSMAGARVFIALLHDPSQGSVRTSGVFTSTSREEWARMSQQAQRYNAIIKAAATEHGAIVVDIPATNIFTTSALMYGDGIHPNARGYEELATVWWDAVRNGATR